MPAKGRGLLARLSAVSGGHGANDDFNGAVQDGAGFCQLTQRQGRRCSADLIAGNTPLAPAHDQARRRDAAV